MTQHVTRRTVARGAAWSVPVISVASAAPAFAASGDCSVAYAGSSVSQISPNVILVTATSGTSMFTIRMTTAADPNTETSAQNFTQGNSGTQGSGVGCSNATFSGFGSATSIVLNQRARRNGFCTAASGVPRQTVTFEFFIGATPGVNAFNPSNVSLRIFDISSANGAGNLNSTYWDAVGFSTTPSSISSNTQCSAGTGAATLADPFRRANGNQPTNTCASLYRDTFTFSSFPTGSQMVYTQSGGRNGWQFIAIDDFSFTAPCAPSSVVW